MNKPGNFEIMEGYAVFRPRGEVPLEQAVQMITSAIVYAREQHIKKLMVVTNDLTGFGAPDVATRYFFNHDWADAAQGEVCIAWVARPEMIDFEKIGDAVAENVCLRSCTFTSEEDALAWLKRVKWVAEGETIQFTRG